MVFGLFKKKDHQHYLKQANKALAAERYADARADFQEALERCPEHAGDDARQIRDGLDRAGDGLALLNLHEAERSLNAKDLEKAQDHFAMARDLCSDAKLKEQALQGLKRVEGAGEPAPAAGAAQGAGKAAPAAPKAAAPSYHKHKSSCTGSCSSSSQRVEESELPPEAFSDEDRFALAVHPLPGDLPQRYTALGEKFARAYLLIHEGQDARALPILQEMLINSENDIVIYEVALIMYRAGRTHECEELLKRSIRINPQNPTSYLALVHLTAENRRIPEAMELLHRMMELNLMADQAQFMLGELYEATGNQAAALDAWSKSLALPSTAKAAAERLVPLLSAQGRVDEAKFLIKKYLKGCC